ncbi:ribonuclease H-like domain-containing protein [Tanacetum coccineum]
MPGTLEEVDREDEVRNRTNNESTKNTEEDLTEEKENQRFNDSLRQAIRRLKYDDTLVIQGSNVNVMPFFHHNRLTNKKLVETEIRLSLASQSHIQLLGIAEDVLVEIAGFLYPVDFVKLYIKEDRRKPFILGTPFLTTAEVEIRFDKGTITSKSGKSKTNFGKVPKFLCKFKEREKDEFDPETPTSTMNKLIL